MAMAWQGVLRVRVGPTFQVVALALTARLAAAIAAEKQARAFVRVMFISVSISPCCIRS